MHIQRSTWKAGILISALLLLTGCEEPVEPKIAVSIPVPENSPETTLPNRVDPRLPDYQAANAPPLGQLHIVAEQATLQLAQLWASMLSSGDSSLEVRTRTARPESPVRWWRRAGQTQRVALLKKGMDPEEQAAFETEWGYPPKRLVVAMDPMVIVVRKGNPLVHRGISLDELEAIFSDHPHNGNAPIRMWDAFDFGPEWSKRSISPYGQKSTSPLYEWFWRRILRRGMYQSDVLSVSSSGAVVAEVIKNPDGIGYTTLSAFEGPVAPVPIADPQRGTPIVPTADNLFEKLYPLSPGYLYLYINQRPGIALDALQRELVRFVYSQAGQRIAARIGMVPISALHAVTELRRGGIRLTPDDVLLASLKNPMKTGRGN